MIKINYDSKWYKQSNFKRRIGGFMCYFLLMFLSLYDPILADLAMYRELKKQFIDE